VLVAKTRSILFIAVVVLAAGLAGALFARRFADDAVQLSSGTWLPQSRAVAAFTLTDQDGRSFDQNRLAGTPSLLFFGFTHCPDVCPQTLALMARLDQDPPVPGLRTLFVTVDPERDDVAAMKQYASFFSPRIVALTGDDAQIDALMKSVGAARLRQSQPGGGYSVDHSATLFVIDARGRLVAVFSPPFNLAAMRADLAALAPRLDRR
jgi:protein SCO1/2